AGQDMPRVDNTRQLLFEEEDLQALLPHLPPHARNLVEILYLTCWRSSEAFRLQWDDVDWKQHIVRRGSQPDPRRRSAAVGDEDHRPQDRLDLSPVPDRRRGTAGPGHRGGGGASRARPRSRRALASMSPGGAFTSLGTVRAESRA